MIQEKDLKIGMKVKIPKTKSVLCKIENSNVIKRAIENKQDYLFYTGNEYINWYRLNDENYSSGDFFALEDLELYEEPFVLPEKWGVRITEENREILREWVQSKKDFVKVFDTFWLETFVVSEWYDHSYQYYNKSIKNLNKEGYTEISFTEFKQHILKEQIMKLPTENFGIKVTNENAKDVVKWFKEKNYNTQNHVGNAENDSVYWLRKETTVECDISLGVPNNIKVYTLEEIKQIENQTKNDMETKEIIGYKLINPEYQEVVAKLASIYSWSGSSKTIEEINRVISTNSLCREHLEEAGVLDLWFEKVFKKEEEFKIGDWVSFYSETNKKLHTAKIRKLGSSYHYLSDGTEPFVHLLRKATEEEIEAATCKTVKLSIGKNVDIERDKLSNQVYILAGGKIIQYKHINNLYCNTNTFGDTNWTIQYNTFDIGCWKNVTRADLRLILDAYEEINAKLK